MPIYTVMCDQCGKEEDIYRSLAEFNNLPDCCGAAMHRKICAPMVIADIEPYQAAAVDVATGKAPVIKSRADHRAFLRRNGYAEVGNEMPKQEKKEVQGDFNAKKEIREAVREVLPKFTA